MKKLSFAIIGGGPSGFYISKLLSKLPNNPIIDIYQKQLCPFGLIRYGVAPDHVAIKKSEIGLSEIVSYPFFRYFGNGIDKLGERYSGIVYAFGAELDHRPAWLSNNQGIYISNIKMARDLVYWYNGHPSKQNQKLNLSCVRNVAIIGNGNVSIDISRILLHNPKYLEETQIARGALDQLQNSRIRNIQIIGRRGITHSAFTVKEVRELHRLGFKLYGIQQELEASMNNASEEECTALGNHFSNIVRINKRKINFIKENFIIIQEKDIEREKSKQDKKIFFRYLLNPIKIANNLITCQKTSLYGQPFKQKVKSTGVSVNIGYDLLVISTGFEVKPIKEDHFDEIKKQILHSNGCVMNKVGQVDIGKYAVGWCKNGPKGVLDETLLSCEQTFNNIRIHVSKDLLMVKEVPKQPQNFISFSKYAEVREIELGRGMREKFIKKKMSNRELLQFYGLEHLQHQCVT